MKSQEGYSRNFKVLFVSSSGNIFPELPFVKSQYKSLQAYLNNMDFYRIKGSGIKAYISAFKELKTKLKIDRYDIIHAHWTYAGIICASLITTEKLVTSFLGNDLQGVYSTKFNILTLRGIFNIILSQYLLLRSNAIIVKSKRMLRWIPFFVRRKTQLIPNGVDLNKFKAIDQVEARKFLRLGVNNKYILFLADTVDSNKNFKFLKTALKDLDKFNLPYTLLTPYPVDSSLIPYYLAAADVLAFPSKIEGSPNVIKEALAMGCPIVASDVGDVRERIGNISGCYISNLNRFDFANNLLCALQFNKRTEAGTALFEIEESNVAKKIIQLYQTILER